MKLLLATAAFALGALAVPQTSQPTSTGSSGGSVTSVSPEQSSQFRAATASYYKQLLTAPEFLALQSSLAVAGALGGGGILSSLSADPSLLLPVTGTPNLLSLASSPPTSFRTLAWYSDIDPAIVASIQSLQTSAAFQVASIDQSVLGTSIPITVPTASPTSSSSGVANALMPARPTGLAAAGAAVGALGMAVMLL